jgi:choline dehydrogenase-like flavoprotein
LLYPMLRRRSGFEIRAHAQVLRVNYDGKTKRATGVRYLNLNSGEEFEQPADVVVLAAFTTGNTRLLLLSGVGTPYDPITSRGVVGRNFCYQTTSAVDIFFRDRWINPFLAAGCTSMVIDEFNNDNFDHSGLPFLGGHQWTADTCAPHTAWHSPLGDGLETSHGRLVRALLFGWRAGQLLPASREFFGSGPGLHRCVRPAVAPRDI